MSNWTDTLLGWLPKRTSARAAAVPQQVKMAGHSGRVSIFGPGQPRWSAHSVKAYADEGFAGNPVA